MVSFGRGYSNDFGPLMRRSSPAPPRGDTSRAMLRRIGCSSCQTANRSRIMLSRNRRSRRLRACSTKPSNLAAMMAVIRRAMCGGLRQVPRSTMVDRISISRAPGVAISPRSKSYCGLALRYEIPRDGSRRAGESIGHHALATSIAARSAAHA